MSFHKLLKYYISSLPKYRLKLLPSNSYIFIRKMSDDAYLKMLNDNNNFSSETASASAHNSGNKFEIERLGKDTKTQWVSSLVKSPKKAVSTSNDTGSELSSQLKDEVLKISNGLTFYSEADFAFEFFQFEVSHTKLPTDDQFLDLLKNSSPKLPSNLSVSQISVANFFKKTDDSESSEEGNTFETFQNGWNKIKSHNSLQETVYYVKDADSSYNYYFLAFFSSENSTLFGLVTVEVQT